MITSIFIKMIMVDLLQDNELEETLKIITSILIILLIAPIAIIFDIALIPIEIGVEIIYLIKTRKDRKSIKNLKKQLNKVAKEFEKRR